MQTEYARQTRWGHDPEPVDPDQTSPGSTYVKHVVWMPCNHCDLQVHVTQTQFLTRGLTCPECGDPLAIPPVPAQPNRLAQMLQQEEIFQQQIQKVKLPCSD
jgi:hypothetical protein